MRVIAVVFGVALLAGATSGQEPTEEQKKRIAELKEQIAAKKAELAKLEAELTKLNLLEPPTAVDYLFVTKLELNTYGPLGASSQLGGRLSYHIGALRVTNVIDERRMTVTVIPGAGVKEPTNPIQILIVNYDTKGIADGKVINPSPTFRVIGTEKVGEKTLYALEPYSPPKKK